jgi:hypothetical protein
MATYTLQTPSKPAFNAVGVRNSSGFQATVDPFFQAHDKDLKFIEENCKVPSEIIVAIVIAVSKSPEPNPVRPEINKGLMGWSLLWGAGLEGKRTNAKVVLNYEYSKGRMTSKELEKLKSFGLNYNKVATKTAPIGFNDITPELQTNNSFNLLYGAILLGQLMDSKGYGIDTFANWPIDDRLNLHLERIIVVFLNGGDTSKSSVQKAISRRYETAISLLDAIKTEDPFSASTISRVLGTGGYLEMLVHGFRSNGISYSASKFKHA